MSFATLCLTLVHVFGTWLGQLTVGSLENPTLLPFRAKEKDSLALEPF
jgi:hypothetical protein